MSRASSELEAYLVDGVLGIIIDGEGCIGADQLDTLRRATGARWCMHLQRSVNHLRESRYLQPVLLRVAGERLGQCVEALQELKLDWHVVPTFRGTRVQDVRLGDPIKL